MPTLTFNVADDMDKLLEDLKKEMGKTSKGEVMRVAISVLKVLQDAKAKKQEFGIDTDNDGKIEKLIVLP